MRKLFFVVMAGSLGLLAGCGGSGGGSTPVGVPTTITLSPNVGKSILAGGSLSISATVTTGSSSSSSVTWSLSGPGTLSSPSANPVTYTAPSSVTANTPVAVIATANSQSNYLPLTVLPASATNTNTVPLVVDGGPAPPYPDGVFTSVNICSPGTNTCQTVDHVLVDTGSYGLRILQSVLNTSLSLPELTDTNNNTIFNCVAFLDGSYLWGPVSEADLRLNGEVAGQSLVQVISSSNSGIPTACTNGGTINENTPQLLGANGILGIGGEPTDCELAGTNFCDGSLGQIAPIYFSCPNGSCGSGDQPVTIPESNQIVNPVVLFDTDNNGDLLTMPALTSPAATASGTMTFGIGTQANNALGTASNNLLTLDSSDSFQVSYAGQNLTSGFIDSGSNGVFFANFLSPITVCADNSSYFCPNPSTTISPINTGTNSAVSTVTFTVENADTLLANPADAAVPDLAGPQDGNPPTSCNGGSGDCVFDYGFPFFYGNTVFTAIDGQSAPTATAPWFAYTNPNP